MDDEYKIVDFGKYCKSCKHADKSELEDPCFECMDEFINLHSDRPVKWEESDEHKNSNNKESTE